MMTFQRIHLFLLLFVMIAEFQVEVHCDRNDTTHPLKNKVDDYGLVNQLENMKTPEIEEPMILEILEELEMSTTPEVKNLDQEYEDYTEHSGRLPSHNTNDLCPLAQPWPCSRLSYKCIDDANCSDHYMCCQVYCSFRCINEKYAFESFFLPNKPAETVFTHESTPPVSKESDNLANAVLMIANETSLLNKVMLPRINTTATETNTILILFLFFVFFLGLLTAFVFYINRRINLHDQLWIDRQQEMRPVTVL